jgi:indole-3-glycerol phosphate synthase
MNILDEITAYTRERIDEQKSSLNIDALIRLAHFDNDDDFPFEKAIVADDITFIGEVKKASPSKGVIHKTFPYVQIAKDYEAAGISAISVLTEPHYFKGENIYLTKIHKAVQTPLLRKDFIIDSYMIYEAKVLGASAILLICAILDKDTLKSYINIAHSLGMSALVETHNKKEIDMALRAGARIIGVNNRNLKTFKVDISLTQRLREYVPKDIIFVSESGIVSADDIRTLRCIGVNSALIGETFMRSPDISAELKKLKG